MDFSIVAYSILYISVGYGAQFNETYTVTFSPCPFLSLSPRLFLSLLVASAYLSLNWFRVSVFLHSNRFNECHRYRSPHPHPHPQTQPQPPLPLSLGLHQQ